MNITIFDGKKSPYSVNLEKFQKNMLYFGRLSGNDIVLESRVVSAEHGRFAYVNGSWRIEDREVYLKRKSTNGLIYNYMYINSKEINDGDVIRIDCKEETVKEGVLLVFSEGKINNDWKYLRLNRKTEIKIGRNQGCDIVLPHSSVSRNHAKILKEENGYYIIDQDSANGIIVNDREILKKEKLHEKDIISITGSKLIFTSEGIYYYSYNNGISVDTVDVVVERGKGKKAFITCNHVSLNIKPGELVAIIGGSGAGKSTILNCMCGYLEPTSGEVFINGINLYRNFQALNNLIGYVPQSDIVYDNLTLYDMLWYTAKLRLPKDTTNPECEKAIQRAIELVELSEKKNSLIKALSGGQRKRASIAVELLSDPKLLFLDEPASGLDPGTERNLMHSLREMANHGKTVILVTHSTLQLKLCDKIVFMGKGGNLCFCGNYQEALEFFCVEDVIDIYNMITDFSEKWKNQYSKCNEIVENIELKEEFKNHKTKNRCKQLIILCRRYMKLIINDRQRLLLLLLQAPILALLISFVADGKQYEQYEMTKSLLFALSCSAFWIGMLNAIQEICKERTILKREYMTGLSMTSYILSKITVLGLLCLIQSILIVTIFSALIGIPDKGIIMVPYLEILITTFLTASASAAMGLFVSALFKNADRAMTVAPVLLMPQILFSGLIFKLKGVTDKISYMAVCRWGMEGFGTTANLNDLPLRLQQEGIVIPHEAEKYFKYTDSHMIKVWGILFLYTLIFLIIARIVLIGLNENEG